MHGEQIDQFIDSMSDVIHFLKTEVEEMLVAQNITQASTYFPVVDRFLRIAKSENDLSCKDEIKKFKKNYFVVKLQLMNIFNK